MLENLTGSSRSKGIAKPEARSRVSNGKDLFLDGVDGRSVLARRYRDILSQLTSDIGGDPSEAQSIIIRRATQLAVWCEQAEAEAAGGKDLNIGEYATATNTLRRLLADLGLERRMRDVTPSIEAYLTGSKRRNGRT
jgi:hypothetical protein